MNKQKQAFTLVELIVVITILAILGTIAFISLQGYSKDARDSIRISDISSIKTSLELFHLNSGKYPLPDNNQIVDYGTETLWYQGDFGSSVISSLSRSMSEIPTDPLTEKKYVFSVANNKNEFEILSLLEGDSLALNNISQTNAASLVVTPKIDGTYNRVFIKTVNYIVPVPSIINTEVGEAPMTLDSDNIASQVTNGGENIPEQGNVLSNTGALTGLVLSVYTGSIAIDDSNEEKEIVIGKIKEAYTGSVLASSDIYNYILSSSGELENVTLINSLVLKDDTTKVTIVPDPYSSCTGINTPSSFNSITTYDSCDIPDIVVCNGVKSGIIIAGCNVGATTGSEYNLCVDEASCTIARSGELFQWGNNSGLKNASTSSTQIGATTSNSTYSSGSFIVGASFPSPYDWTSSQNDNLWGHNGGIGTNEQRKGPCIGDYHVPSQVEWGNLVTAGDWNNSAGDIGYNMLDDLKMPMAGFRFYSNGVFANQGTYAHYWASEPYTTYGYYMYIYSNTIDLTNANFRSSGFPVRCFKN